MAQSVDNKAKTKIVKCGRGSVCFSSDFITFGELKSVANNVYLY